MDRFATAFASIGLVALIGCGSNEPPQLAQQNSPPAAAAVASASNVDAVQAVTPTSVSPTDVVSLFLDEVRRGGEDSRANDFLTARAREALAEIGQSVRPLGTPDARYQVTRAQAVPGDENSMLVHCIWSEPAQQGAQNDFEVVWAVQRESVGWRISGLAIQIDPNSDPVVLDFENSELMARHLAPASTAPAGEQASAPANAVSR